MGGRGGGLAGLVETLLGLVGLTLEPWMAPAALLFLVVLALPWIRSNVRTDDARRLLKQAARASGAERDRLEAEALARVEGRPDGLVVVAEAALAQGRTAVARAAVERLRATGKRPTDVRKIERALEGPAPATPMEAVLLVERLLGLGMTEEARLRWEKAHARWPEDADLAALVARFPVDA